MFNLEAKEEGILPLFPRGRSLPPTPWWAWWWVCLMDVCPAQGGSCCWGGGAVLGTEKVHQKGVKGLGSGRPVASSARTSASAVLKEALAPSESSESGENPNHHNKQTRWGALSRFQPTSASTGSPALSGGHVTLRGLGS